MKTKKELFDKWAKRVREKVAIHPLEMIYWESTRNCDMSCIHCGSPLETWQKETQLETNEVINVFREISESFDISELKFVSITGGEPFVREDLLHILEQINSFGFNVITIQTNGNALARQPKLLNVLTKLNVRGIGTNIDGLEKTHDSFRNSEGSFANAVKAANIISKKKRLIHSTVSTVVSKKNILELNELSKIIRKINPHRWRLMAFDPIGRGKRAEDYLLEPNQYKLLLEFIKEERVKYIRNKSKTQIEFACGGWLGIELEGYVRPYIWHCVAGINTLGILYDGGIASCSNIPRDFIEGNVRTDKIVEVWNNRYEKFRNFEWKRTGDCSNCDQWDYCHGGPMHKRLADGTMLNCIYKMLKENKDYNKDVLVKAYTTVSGN